MSINNKINISKKLLTEYEIHPAPLSRESYFAYGITESDCEIFVSCESLAHAEYVKPRLKELLNFTDGIE